MPISVVEEKHERHWKRVFNRQLAYRYGRHNHQLTRRQKIFMRRYVQG